MQTLEKTGQRSIDWAIGLFEGEGTIKVNTYKKGKPYYAAAINMTDGDVLEEFHKVVGVGRLYGPYTFPSKKKHHKPMFSWNVSKKADLKSFLELILPQLCHRRAKKAQQVLRQL